VINNLEGIDGKYTFLSILQNANHIIVLKVQDTHTGEVQCCKLFDAYAQTAFWAESTINDHLPVSPFLLRATRIVPVDQVTQAAVFPDHHWTIYSYIIMPFCSNGTLLEFVQKLTKLGQPMPTIVLKSIFRQLVEGIAMLHSVGSLVHLDLKPENVMIRDDFTITIIDFGLS
jgi:serine/threonine protein kinase